MNQSLGFNIAKKMQPTMPVECDIFCSLLNEMTDVELNNLVGSKYSYEAFEAYVSSLELWSIEHYQSELINLYDVIVNRPQLNTRVH